MYCYITWWNEFFTSSFHSAQAGVKTSNSADLYESDFILWSTVVFLFVTAFTYSLVWQMRLVNAVCVELTVQMLGWSPTCCFQCFLMHTCPHRYRLVSSRDVFYLHLLQSCSSHHYENIFVFCFHVFLLLWKWINCSSQYWH